MTTILIINAVSSLLASVGIGGFLVREKLRVRRNATVQPLCVISPTTRPLPPAAIVDARLQPRGPLM
jgi:hypothetical protein